MQNFGLIVHFIINCECLAPSKITDHILCSLKSDAYFFIPFFKIVAIFYIRHFYETYVYVSGTLQKNTCQDSVGMRLKNAQTFINAFSMSRA